MISPVVLIIQEDHLLQHYLCDFLDKSAYKCITAPNYIEGLALLHSQNPDIVVADFCSSVAEGWQFLRNARNCSQAPIIILSAIKEDHCVVHTLEIGADDYIKKPFNPNELGARIEAILRRSPCRGSLNQHSVFLEDVKITFKEQSFSTSLFAQRLTRLEIVLLNYLVKNEGHVLTNQEILTNIWGSEFKDDHQLLRTAVARLKKKMHNYPKMIESIRNIPRVGYLFDYGTQAPNAAE